MGATGSSPKINLSMSFREDVANVKFYNRETVRHNKIVIACRAHLSAFKSKWAGFNKDLLSNGFESFNKLSKTSSISSNVFESFNKLSKLTLN